MKAFRKIILIGQRDSSREKGKQWIEKREEVWDGYWAGVQNKRKGIDSEDTSKGGEEGTRCIRQRSM